ncbi:hypothetical protein M1L60_00970 [Actinoplanes sp. TRM 88003]|uniref:Uncharacterized protein n=1 Tax=Paractinoplanes aksuensis TaxID=2939490 RepID=A0ABT1DH86_9ACTN|nr:hypothetical protein [Actinoplanes aksuensis]MCO8269156.1 hypothetical protein [Actinoplanes aksuensis]
MRRLSYMYAGIGILLLLGSFALLYPLRHNEGFGDELRINIGANLFDLVLAVLVLQPLVLSLNRNAVKWRNRLDYREVIRLIDRAHDQVDIWRPGRQRRPAPPHHVMIADGGRPSRVRGHDRDDDGGGRGRDRRRGGDHGHVHR